MKMIIGFSLLFFLLVSGCATVPKGVEPLTADELRAMLPGNTVYVKGDGFEYFTFYEKDGAYRGKAWGNWGEDPFKGKWEIKDTGEVCYDNPKNKEPNCRLHYPDKKENTYISVSVSGPTRNKVVKYNVFPGNKYKY